MKLIRNGVFETNSSSAHSICIGSHCEVYDTLMTDKDGFVNAYPGEYGWEIEEYYDSQSKLNYIYTFISEEKNEQNKSSYLNLLKEVVIEHVGCRGVIFNEPESKYSCYIDHQSAIYEGGPGLEALESKEKLKEFLFNPNSFVRTDNDNY